ncbi:MAG TPA: TIM barrel protein [Pirellulales bacterium]|jgi:hydroxypyruvate isomerase|nr:TIM barrel protein [Pirellulales bacterium]
MTDFAPNASAASFSRRRLLGAAAAGAATIPWLGPQAAGAAQGTAATRGRIKQSIVFWCFNVGGDKWDMDRTCQVARELGCVSVELAAPDQWDTLKKYGLTCAIAPNGMPGAPFMRGFNNLAYHDEVIGRTKQAIDDCAAAGFPSVIAFTGYKWRKAEDPTSGEIGLEEGAENCERGLKQVAEYAEKKGVTICLEHLNTRDNTHPMKGHPGYQGDDVDWVADMLRRVRSERVKLLFDCYHVQIMNGDLIRRIGQMKDIIGHVHTAGNPGRGELDENQEIQYPPVMNKLIEIGYTGYVGQEFIPTRDPLAGLRQAVGACDV